MRTVDDIRADVATGRLSRLFAIGEIREVTGCGLREAVAILDGAPPRPRLQAVKEDPGEGPPAPSE
jgi:ribosomal protein L7/L12